MKGVLKGQAILEIEHINDSLQHILDRPLHNVLFSVLDVVRRVSDVTWRPGGILCRSARWRAKYRVQFWSWHAMQHEELLRLQGTYMYAYAM